MYRKDKLTISRLVVSGSTKQYTATGAEIYGVLDPVGSEFASIADGAFGKVYTFTTPQVEVDVRVADRLTKGTQHYEVKGKQTFSNARVPVTILQLVEAQL